MWDVLNVKKKIGSTGVDIDSYAELEFDKKFKSKIGASFTKNLGKETKIIGEKGEILIEDTWHGGDCLIKIKDKKDYKIKIKSYENIFAHEIENLSDSALKDKKESNYPGMHVWRNIIKYENFRKMGKWLRVKFLIV